MSFTETCLVAQFAPVLLWFKSRPSLSLSFVASTLYELDKKKQVKLKFASTRQNKSFSLKWLLIFYFHVACCLLTIHPVRTVNLNWYNYTFLCTGQIHYFEQKPLLNYYQLLCIYRSHQIWSVFQYILQLLYQILPINPLTEISDNNF